MRRLLEKYQRGRDRFWKGVTYGVGALLVLWGLSTILVTAKEGPQKGLEFALSAPGYALDAVVTTAKAGYDKCKPKKKKKKHKKKPRERDNDKPVCRDCPRGAYLYQGMCYPNRFGRPREEDAFLPKWCKREEEPITPMEPITPWNSGPGYG